MWILSLAEVIRFAGRRRYDSMRKLVLHSSYQTFGALRGRIFRTMAQNARLQSLGMLVLCVLLYPAMTTAQQPALNLMPLPASVQSGTGSLRVDSSFSVAFTGYTEPRLERAAERFLRQLARQTGLPLALKSAQTRNQTGKATLVIQTDHASKEIQEVGEDESYILDVSTASARLRASTPLGTMHGLQTFLQLVDVSPDGFAAPAVTIQDKPRFPWRGLMIDSARHFIPPDVLRRNIDGMEAVKMNVFHWHLSENQGFRVESRKFPKLHELGSDGIYDTQDEVRDDLVGEMVKLFPGTYFHSGGDEVNGKEWDANPKIQEYKKSHNLKPNDELQAYFSQRVQKIVTKYGKSVVGWDEVFIPGVPKDIVIQSWRGQQSLTAAAQQGYHGILSNGYYLDLGWSAARHYAVDPISGPAAALTDDQKKLILGGESCMWSEYVNAENVDSRIWPRNAAIAERLWSPQSVTDPVSMYSRLDVESARLEWLGLTHRTYERKMLQRIAGPATPEEFSALRTLANVVEPVKDYSRERTAAAEPTSQTPLNRVVDAVPLESDSGRHFSELVDKFLASTCRDSAAANELRRQFTLWSQNDATFSSLAQKSFLANEVVATSRDLSAIGNVGLRAVDAIAAGTLLSTDQQAQLNAVLTEAAKPKTQLF